MLKKLNPLTIQRVLREKRIAIFSPRDLERIFDSKRGAVNFFLTQHQKDGFFIKLRNGLYALDAHFPPEPFIANKLYEPSYLSLEYALSYYHMIPEVVYTLTSVTPKATREFKVRGILYNYTRIRKDFFTGYTLQKFGSSSALLATPEKALTDYLYLVDLGKKSLNERLTLQSIRKKKCLGYLKLLRRSSLDRLSRKVL